MIRVKDIDSSLKFYKEVLGLKVLRTMELDDCTLYFISDAEENVTIELTYNHELPEGGYSHGDYFGHLAFDTENMDEFTKVLNTHGLKYEIEPFEIKKGLKIAFVNDPDGRSIEVIERN
jgi:lactoylglutathione lyase